MVNYKFEEDRLLEELRTYIDATYNQHYIGKDNVQAFEFIAANGHGTGFCIGNVMKYAQRYGKKEGTARRDLFKIIHYAMMQLWLHDDEEEKRNKKE